MRPRSSRGVSAFYAKLKISMARFWKRQLFVAREPKQPSFVFPRARHATQLSHACAQLTDDQQARLVEGHASRVDGLALEDGAVVDGDGAQLERVVVVQNRALVELDRRVVAQPRNLRNDKSYWPRSPA